METTKKTRAQVDLLHGPIFRSMLEFAVPIFISCIFQQLYNTMDTVIVGHTLGESSLAAMGACTSLYDLLVGFALGIGNGLAIVTARSFGSGDEKLLKRSVAASVEIGIGITVFIMLLTRLVLHPMLQLLNTPSEILEEAYSYISTITLFVGVMFAYNLCAGLLRAVGNSFMPLVFLVLSSCLNIGLDLLFIRQFGMGVRGAAVATVIAQGVSVVLCLVYIGYRMRLLIPKKEDFRPKASLLRELLGQGIAMGLMSCLVSAGSVVLQSGINSLGYLTIAGHAAARKLYQFGIMPTVAMAQTVNTFVAQNRGADQGQRIRQGIRCAYLYNVAVALFMTGLMAALAPQLIRLISGSDEAVVLQNGSAYVRVAAPFYAVLGMINDTRYALQGLGQKLRPLISSITELIGKILFAAALIPRFGYTAVIFCEPVIWCIMATELVYAFYKDPYIKAHRTETQVS